MKAWTCFSHSSSLDAGERGKNIHVGLGKANNNNNKATTKENFISSWFFWQIESLTAK